MLTEKDQEVYAEPFAPFTLGHAGQYVYHIKGQDTNEHLQRIGELMQRLLVELQPGYGQAPVYQVLERVFGEHFKVEEKVLKVKIDKELSASSLQSPDDLEATFRQKNRKSYRGYVANIAETCDPDNKLQLVTKVQVSSNHADDAELLVNALPNLKERTDLDTLYTDGGYGSPDADQTLHDHHVEQIQTAIRGRVPSNEKLNLSDFKIKQTETGKPTQITCPNEVTEAVHLSSQKKSYVAHFSDETCLTCPFVQKCPAQRGKKDLRFHLRFKQKDVNVSQRRQRSLIHLTEGRNLRAAVESTIRQVKHPFPASKLPVRGHFRVTCMMIGSAMMANVSRIQRYLDTRPKLEIEKKKVQNERQCPQEPFSVSFFARLNWVWSGWNKQISLCTQNFG